MPSKTISMGDKPLATHHRRLCCFLAAVRENTADAIIPRTHRGLAAWQQIRRVRRLALLLRLLLSPLGS